MAKIKGDLVLMWETIDLDDHKKVIDFLQGQSDRIKKLTKENEQLKQQIKDMQIRFKRKYDYEFDEIVDELDLGDVND